ncbi:hypothetical protein GCM10009080_06870 [Cupriavidus pauculus]
MIQAAGAVARWAVAEVVMGGAILWGGGWGAWRVRGVRAALAANCRRRETPGTTWRPDTRTPPEAADSTGT